MEKLIEQMQMDMTLQLFSGATIKSYMRHIKNFTDYFGQSIEKLTEDDLRKYLYHIKVDKNYSSSSLTQAFSAIKFLYRETLKMPLSLTKLRGPKRVRSLPIVLSREEVKKILDSAENPKHRLILMTTYSAGLRVSETAHLTINDIDSSRMQIRVVQGKGKKDRYTLLSAPLLDKLRDYWRVYRPAIWLFPGKLPCQPIAVSTIQRIFKRAKKKPGSLSQPHPIPSVIALRPIF
jgi:integrase/recombinase XerD